MMTQSKRRAVITGGAKGIGLSCAKKLKAASWSIVILDSDERAALEVANMLDAEYYVADVTSMEDLQRVAACLQENTPELGPVAALVNSAGIVQPPLSPAELSMEIYDRVLNIDQRGTYLSCKVFGQLMVAQRHGAIVNIASITGMRSVPLHSYAPAKAAVISMTECLAGEWGPAGVRVNCVSPGYTLTARVQTQIDEGERNAKQILDNSALGRLVAPEEVAAAVSFLISSKASAITGVNLPVDCGWLLGPSWSTYGGLRGHTVTS